MPPLPTRICMFEYKKQQQWREKIRFSRVTIHDIVCPTSNFGAMCRTTPNPFWIDHFKRGNQYEKIHYYIPYA